MISHNLFRPVQDVDSKPGGIGCACVRRTVSERKQGGDAGPVDASDSPPLAQPRLPIFVVASQSSRTSPDVMSFNLQEAVLTLHDPEDGILIDDELDIPSLAEREVEDYLERTSPPLPPPLEASWELF